MHANPIRSDEHGKFARIFNKEGHFLGIASLENGWVRPRVVLTSMTSGRGDMLGCILEKETGLNSQNESDEGN
jgi:hypothetical protein